MHLTDTPPIEPLLFKQVVEDSLTSNLNVTQPGPYPTDSVPLRYRSDIGRVSYPTDSSITSTIYTWHSHFLELVKVVLFVSSESNSRTVLPMNR